MLANRSTALVKRAIVSSGSPCSSQYDLPHLMQGGLGGIELRKNIFTGNVFVNHPVDCLHLSDNLLEAAMQIFGIHALFHGGVS